MLTRRALLRSSFQIGALAQFSDGLDPAPKATGCEPAHAVSMPQSKRHERVLASVPSLDVYGLPRSWSMVRDGLHPISPERVVIVPKITRRLICTRSDHDVERVKNLIRLHSVNIGAIQRDISLSEVKLELILAITATLSDFYGCDDRFEQWAMAFAAREELASTGMGNGFGLPHQFQPIGQRLKTFNSPVDWWLFLYPEGADWECYDGRPLYWMIVPVFTCRLPGFEMRVLERIVKSYGHVLESEADALAWGAQLAVTNRESAAKIVNRFTAIL